MLNSSCLLGKLAASSGLHVGLQQLMKCFNLLVKPQISLNEYLSHTLSTGKDLFPLQAEGDRNAWLPLLLLPPSISQSPKVETGSAPGQV